MRICNGRVKGDDTGTYRINYYNHLGTFVRAPNKHCMGLMSDLQICDINIWSVHAPIVFTLNVLIV
jgi:hypothetical protein